MTPGPEDKDSLVAFNEGVDESISEMSVEETTLPCGKPRAFALTVEVIPPPRFALTVEVIPPPDPPT